MASIIIHIITTVKTTTVCIIKGTKHYNKQKDNNWSVFSKMLNYFGEILYSMDNKKTKYYNQSNSNNGDELGK